MKRFKKSMLGLLIANLVAPSLALASPTTENRDAYSKETEVVKKTATYEEKKITLKAKKEKELSKEPEKVDYELLIDGSGSMRDTGSLEKTKEAVNDFIDQRNAKYERVGVSVFRGPGYSTAEGKLVYNTITKTLSDYSSDFDKVKETVGMMEAGGLTPLYDGLDYILPKMNETSRAGVRKVLIIFADGHPNIGPSRDYYISNSGYELYNNKNVIYPATQEYVNELRKLADEALDEGDFDKLDKYEGELEQILADYPLGNKHELDGINQKLDGRLYENHKQEFFDLMHLIEEKADAIKNEGYEIFTVYLDNSSKDPKSKVVNNKGEAENLFRRISTDEAHYLPAENVSLLPEMFERINDSMTKFVYDIKDTIEEGYTLMPETIKEDRKGVKMTHSDKEIEWKATAVDYDELTVSYHIYREITPSNKTGELIVKHVTENGQELVLPIKTTEKVGTTYDTSQQDFDGYEFVKLSEDSAKPTGEYVEGTTNVTYIYKAIDVEPEEKFGSLVVRHITEDGKELTPLVGTTDKVGATYNTSQQDFDGYQFVKLSEDSGKESGEYVEGTTNVTYIYKAIDVEPGEKFGSLVVRHITEDGKELTPLVGTTEKVGTTYDTSQEDFDGYQFVKLSEDSGKASGEYVEGTTEVTYIYKAIDVEPEEKFGSLVVRHITEDGKELTPLVGTTEKVGTTYDTSQQDFDGYQFVKLSEDSAKPTGEYVEGTTEVTYIYKAIDVEPEEKFGSLVVRHITEDGKELTPLVGTTEKVGTTYDTSQQDFDGYQFVKLSEDSGKASGEYVEGTTEVTYIYKAIDVEPEEKFGSLVVRHITEDGKELTPLVGTTEKVGTTYDTSQQDFDGYQFVKLSEDSGKASGEYVEGTTEVTYIYKAIDVEPEEKFGSLVVRHITEDGKELTPLVGTTEKVGTTYDTSQQDFDGYQFVKLSEDSAKPTGEYVEGTTEVNYIYKAIDVEPEEKFGSLVVRHITEDGKELTPIVGKTEKVGTTYDTSQQDFDGYQFVKLSEDSAKPTGEYVEGTTEVTYIYKAIDVEPEKKFGSLVVRHITEDGKELTSLVGTTEKVGTTYDTSQQDFDGYQFVKLSEDSAKPTGEYVEGTTNVTYIYKAIDVEPEEKFGSLVVRHITEDGKELTPIVGKTEKVGTTYDTSQQDFDGYQFVKLSEDSAKPTGEYVEGTTEVTYIYKAIDVEPEEKFGSLVVRHITEDGKELTPLVGTTEKVGTTYDTSQQDFDGYQFVKLSEDSGKASGEYVEGTTEVTYIYKAIDVEPEEKFGSLVVRHITEDGKELTPLVGTTEKVGTTYDTSQQDFDGYQFVKLSEDSGKASGEYVEGTTEVTYIYKAIDVEPEEKFGSLVVRHITEDGKELTPLVGTTEKVGTTYDTSQQDFDGYQFVKLSEDSGKASGEYVEGTTEVTYIYKKIVKLPFADKGESLNLNNQKVKVGTILPLDSQKIKNDKVPRITDKSELKNYKDISKQPKVGSQTNLKNDRSGLTNSPNISDNKPNHKMTKTKVVKALPQTGEVNNKTTLLIGIALLTSTLGLCILKKISN